MNGNNEERRMKEKMPRIYCPNCGRKCQLRLAPNVECNYLHCLYEGPIFGNKEDRSHPLNPVKIRIFEEIEFNLTIGNTKVWSRYEPPRIIDYIGYHFHNDINDSSGVSSPWRWNYGQG